MRIQILLLLGFLSASAIAQDGKREKLTKDKIHEIMLLVENGDVEQAIEASRKYSTDPYHFGMDVRKAGLKNKAIDWFVAMVEHSEKTSDKADYYYGKAWIHFKMGGFKEALDDGEFLLTVNPSPITLARTYYMMGRIYLQWDNFEKAKDYFFKSQKSYTKQNKTGGVYLSCMGLAEVAIYEKDYTTADNLLATAEEYRAIRNFYSPASIMALKAEIIFRQNQFEDFIEKATEVLTVYQQAGDEGNALWMNIKIAMALALSCQLNDAYDLSVKNEEIIQSTSNTLAQQYNNITRIIFRANWNQNAQELINEVQLWIDGAEAGNDLQNLLTLALSVDCKPELDIER